VGGDAEVLYQSVLCFEYTVKSRLLAALVDKLQAQIMCQKSGKTLIPIDKTQVYFVDVVKCSTRYAHRDDAFSAAHCLECASPK